MRRREFIGVLGGAPFVALCGLTPSVTTLVLALTVWGFFKGLYDANIFASVFDVVRPEARGTAAGFMNAVGWLAGGGSAPLAIGIIAQRESLGLAIALASTGPMCEPRCRGLHMATNLSIDPELIERALELSGERTKKAAVTKALQEFIARRRQKRVLELFGKLEWDAAYDYKAERKRR